MAWLAVAVFAAGPVRSGGRRRSSRRSMAGRAASVRARVEGEVAGPALHGQWGDLSLADRRDVLRSAVGVVWIARGNGDRIRVVAKGFEPANLSRPGVSGPMAPVPDGVLPGTIRLES